jgi:curved DNA-binding protein CbpA
VASRTHYEIMMLHPSATPEVISAVYRQLAKQHHPDHAGPESERRMAEINEAFAILSHAEKRARYDTLMGIAGGGPDPRSAASSGASASASGQANDTTSSRASAPGATNLKYEAGSWSIREPWEATPAPPQFGEAGPPPRHLPAHGRAISFGRYRGWTVSQVASYDRNYIEWLSRTMAGRAYQAELKQALSQTSR